MKIDLNVSVKANSGVALNAELGATGESDTGAAESLIIICVGHICLGVCVIVSLCVQISFRKEEADTGRWRDVD